MKKKIFIHIGFGKTGTSAIQEYLFNNKKNNNQSYYYPKTGLKGNAHHNLATLNQENLSKINSKLYSELVEELYKDNTDVETIISSENFCFTKPNYIKNIYQYLQNFDVRIVFYIRNQIALIQSSFLQAQKAGLDYRGSIENYFKNYALSFDFMKRIHPWAENFGTENIIARLYDKRVVGSNICKDFLKITDTYNGQSLPVKLRVNESLAPEFADIISLIDQGVVTPRERKMHIDYFLKLSSQFREASQVTLVRPELQENIHQYYLASNTEFSQFFLDDEQEKYLLNSV